MREISGQFLNIAIAWAYHYFFSALQMPLMRASLQNQLADFVLPNNAEHRHKCFILFRFSLISKPL